MIIWQIGKNANKDHTQKTNYLNEPIKNTVGIILLMPTGFGFNIISLLIIVCSLWSINGANQIYTAAMNQQLHHSLRFDNKYFIEQKIQLQKFALDYVATSYCAKLLGNMYNKAYGNGDTQYANIINDYNSKYQTEADVSGNYYEIIPIKDIGEAQIGGRRAICGEVAFKYQTQTANYISHNNASNIASGGLIGQSDEKFNKKFNQLAQDLRQKTQEIWHDQAKSFMDEINNYIDNTLPHSNYDEKYQNLNQNLPNINQIIQSHQQQLAQRLSQATDSNNGFMHQIHQLYLKKMKEGGLLNAIGYRQHLGQLRKFILDMITDQYVIPSGATKFAPYLPNDSISQTAQAVFYGTMDKVQYSINTQSQSINKCPIHFEKLATMLENPQQSTQIMNEFSKISSNQLATVLNILLGKTDIICAGYSNITESNVQNQSESLDRLQQAGAMLSNFAKHSEITKKYMEFKDTTNKNQQNPQNPQNSTTNSNPSTNQGEKSMNSIIKEFDQSIPMLKSASTWLSVVLPSILDFFLIFAIVLFPIKIVMEMIIGSVSAMMMFVPNNKSYVNFAKNAIALILYLPAVVIGYFCANVILNYVLELAIGLSFESMHYSLMQGGAVDIDHFKTVVMIFVSIGGAVTMMCGGLILGVPMAINRFLQASDGDSAMVSNFGNKMDTSIGSAGAGSAAAGQFNSMGAGRDRHEEFGKNNAQDSKTMDTKPQQIVSDEQGVQVSRDKDIDSANAK